MRTVSVIRLALLAGVLSFQVAAAAERPNVLLILADDLNDWVGALGGHPEARTPSIDRLAQSGVLFREAYAASPKCNPSRTALLLGRSPATTGIYDNGHWWRPHLPEAVTLPEAFRAGGYLVAGGGKIFHHTAGFNPPDIWDQLFELQFDDPWDRGSAAYPQIAAPPPPPGHPYAGLEPFRHELDWGALPIEEGEYGDARTVAWAERFLEQEHDKPFFLAVGLFHPHLPWYAPEEFFEQFPADSVSLPTVPPADLDDVPAEGRRLAATGGEPFHQIREAGKWREAVAAYLANIAFADQLVGRIVSALEASPYAGDTIVVFASDHGFHLGEKQHWYKSTLWERATHVPLIVKAPDRGAGVSDRPVSLLDLYPTLLELAGLPSRADLDGQSLVPLLEDPQAQPERAAVITYLAGNHAVRQGRWLYIQYHDDGEELYDRDRDPEEWTNLAGTPELGAVKADLRALLPQADAPAAPGKGAYDFNFRSYRWVRRGSATGSPGPGR